MPEYQKLQTFSFEGQRFAVKYTGSNIVTAGVTCHTYSFEDDNTRDLAIVEVQPGCRTPLQRVLKGDRTIEGYMSGKGSLTVVGQTGQENVYSAEDAKNFPVQVAVGELMQWKSMPDSKLEFYEICYPPYEDGRFENLPDGG